MDEYNVISLICKLKPPLGRWPSIINLMESGRCWAHGQEFPMWPVEKNERGKASIDEKRLEKLLQLTVYFIGTFRSGE